MAGKYNWSNFQTLLLKYFKRKGFYIKEDTKTVRYTIWTRGIYELEIKYYRNKKSETLKGIRIIRRYGYGQTVYDVDLKTYQFGFDEIEKSPYIEWWVNQFTGYRRINFPEV